PYTTLFRSLVDLESGSVDHMDGGCNRPSIREHGTTAQHHLRFTRKEPTTPGDRVPQRAMAEIGSDVFSEFERTFELLRDLVHSEGGGAGRGKLDCQRQPLQLAANLLYHCARSHIVETGVTPSGSIDEERDGRYVRRRGLCRQHRIVPQRKGRFRNWNRKRAHSEQQFARAAQSLARRNDDRCAHSLRQQTLDDG